VYPVISNPLGSYTYKYSNNITLCYFTSRVWISLLVHSKFKALKVAFEAIKGTMQNP